MTNDDKYHVSMKCFDLYWTKLIKIFIIRKLKIIILAYINIQYMLYVTGMPLQYCQY